MIDKMFHAISHLDVSLANNFTAVVMSAWCFTCEPCISSTVLCSFKNNRTPSTKTRCKYVSIMIHSTGVAYFPRMPSLGFLLLSQSKETVKKS